MCDLWQDEEGIIQSEEETAEKMSSYESEDNQDKVRDKTSTRQVGNKISTLKINTKINDRDKAFSSSPLSVKWIFI